MVLKNYTRSNIKMFKNGKYDNLWVTADFETTTEKFYNEFG